MHYQMAELFDQNKYHPIVVIILSLMCAEVLRTLSKRVQLYIRSAAAFLPRLEIVT
ncbi:hypothetical protein D3C77_473080 [compost metagenome]